MATLNWPLQNCNPKKKKEVIFFGDTYDMYLPSQCINFLDVGINCIVHVIERLGATGYS